MFERVVVCDPAVLSSWPHPAPSGVQLEGTPVPLQPRKALKAAPCQKAASHSLCSWGLQNCCLWVICSPETAQRNFLPLPVLVCGRCGCSLPTPEDGKVPYQALYVSSQALTPWQCFSCSRFCQVLLPPQPPAGTSSQPLFSFAANLWWFIFLPVP